MAVSSTRGCRILTPGFGRFVPWSLTLLRLLLAPVMVVLTTRDPDRAAFVFCIVVAFLSDLFDGILARRLGVVSAGLRRFDSIADTIFCVAALYAVWRLHPAVISDNRILLACLAVLEVARYVLDFWKFGREASYHMWSSKFWGLTVFAALLLVLGTGYQGEWVVVAIVAGIVSDLEGLTISLILPRWAHDVPTLFHALLLKETLTT